MVKEEKEAFNKIWKDTQHGNKIYKVMSNERKVIDIFVTKGLLRYLSPKYVKLTKDGLDLGRSANSRYY